MAEFTTEVVVITKLLLDVDMRKMTKKLFLVLYVKQSKERSFLTLTSKQRYYKDEQIDWTSLTQCFIQNMGRCGNVL